jgi:hypothetical protein
VVANDLVHRQRNRGIREIRDHVYALVLNPSPRNRCAEIGLVLMIGGKDFDIATGGSAAMVFDRELCAEDGTGTLIVGIHPGHIVHHPDAHHATRLRTDLTAIKGYENESECSETYHSLLPKFPWLRWACACRSLLSLNLPPGKSSDDCMRPHLTLYPHA